MGAALKKVNPGDPLVLPARTFNAFVDAAEDFQRRQLAQGRRPVPPSARSAGVVVVKNSTGMAQDRFAVLGIDAPLILPGANLDEFRGRVAFSCGVPAADTHEGRFVVLLEPLEADAIGLAVAAGVVQVQIIASNAKHRFAEIDDGSSAGLVSAPAGSARILWRSAATGTVDAVVYVGSPTVPIRGAHDGDLQLWDAENLVWKLRTPGGGVISFHNDTTAPGSHADIDPGGAGYATSVLAHIFGHDERWEVAGLGSILTAADMFGASPEEKFVGDDFLTVSLTGGKIAVQHTGTYDSDPNNTTIPTNEGDMIVDSQGHIKAFKGY